MSGGMRIDPKELPLHHQEQLAAAILAQIAKAAPVEVREETIKRTAKKLVFVNDRAAGRYRILRKMEASGQVRNLKLQKDDDGVISGFAYDYTKMEAY